MQRLIRSIPAAAWMAFVVMAIAATVSLPILPAMLSAQDGGAVAEHGASGNVADNVHANAAGPAADNPEHVAADPGDAIADMAAKVAAKAAMKAAEKLADGEVSGNWLMIVIVTGLMGVIGKLILLIGRFMKENSAINERVTAMQGKISERLGEVAREMQDASNNRRESHRAMIEFIDEKTREIKERLDQHHDEQRALLRDIKRDTEGLS